MGRMTNGGMFGRLHNSFWETLQDTTTESSEGCGPKRQVSLQLKKSPPHFITLKHRKAKKEKWRETNTGIN